MEKKIVVPYDKLIEEIPDLRDLTRNFTAENLQTIVDLLDQYSKINEIKLFQLIYSEGVPLHCIFTKKIII